MSVFYRKFNFISLALATTVLHTNWRHAAWFWIHTVTNVDLHVMPLLLLLQSQIECNVDACETVWTHQPYTHKNTHSNFKYFLGKDFCCLYIYKDDIFVAHIALRMKNLEFLRFLHYFRLKFIWKDTNHLEQHLYDGFKSKFHLYGVVGNMQNIAKSHNIYKESPTVVCFTRSLCVH